MIEQTRYEYQIDNRFNGIFHEILPESKRKEGYYHIAKRGKELPKHVKLFIAKLYIKYYLQDELTDKQKVAKILIPFVVAHFFGQLEWEDKDKDLIFQQRWDISPFPPVLPSSKENSEAEIEFFKNKILAAEYYTAEGTLPENSNSLRGGVSVLKTQVRTYLRVSPEENELTHFVSILQRDHFGPVYQHQNLSEGTPLTPLNPINEISVTA